MERCNRGISAFGREQGNTVSFRDSLIIFNQRKKLLYLYNILSSPEFPDRTLLNVSLMGTFFVKVFPDFL